MIMPVRGRVLQAVTAICLLGMIFQTPAEGQTYSYRTYDNSTGLPGSYLNVISQDSTGFLWIGLETGLFRYDGFGFYSVDLPDTLSTGYPNALFCDRNGAMWIGMTDGSLYKNEPGGTPVRIQDVTADRINRITGDPQGKVWIVSQTGGCWVTEGEKMKHVSAPEGTAVFDIAFTGSDTVLLATQDNLHLCRIADAAMAFIYSFPELEYTWVQSLVRIDGKSWLAGTDGSGIYMISGSADGMSATPLEHPALESLRVPCLVAGKGMSAIAASREAGTLVISLGSDRNVSSVTAYNTSSGLPDNDVKAVFRDREDNIWIGLFNKGLAAVTTNAYSFFTPPSGKEINFIGETGGKTVLGTRTGMWYFDPATGFFDGFRDLNSPAGGSGIASWKSEGDGNILVGTAGNGLWRLDRAGRLKKIWSSPNPGQNYIISIAVDSQNIWMSTYNGVVLADRATGAQKAIYTTREMLPHNNVSQVVVTREGEVLAATESDQLCYIHVTGGVRTEGPAMEGTTRNRIQSLSVAPGGAVAAGTLGNGLFLFSGDTVVNYSAADGLLSNYCYSTLIASDGRVWTGHEKGFSIVNPETGSVRTFGREFGVNGDCLPNAITETSDGNIYVGTTEGVVLYKPASDAAAAIPPTAGIVSVRINNVDYPYRKVYSLPYRSSYTVEVTYAGICLRDPLNVIYRTRMDNFDETWSDPGVERKITYRLTYGRYRFNVEAIDRDRPALFSTASFTIEIQKPFTRTWWFILSVITVFLGLVYLFILLRERAHRKQREYLEEELRKRTAEVYEQKEELAQKNLDITESIKYAKRIQSSVLPDAARLGSAFSEAFVFYLPRDIVSGDFYWFDWIDKERFILACADSTGHGVPGAFMSMIGTALLQDIITVKKITRPSLILHELDRQIFATLNQNQELEASNDGMDIVVCEYNVKTRQLLFSSAMRPVILVIDGEQQYIRGNRSAVGGESVAEKFFDDQEYHLNEGDCIYLFSDGYPDQFGGHGGKKMKISRLRTLITDIGSMPMSEQDIRIKDYFYNWKGDIDQVDDVLMMGFRV